MALEGPCEDQTPVSRGACCKTRTAISTCEEGYHKHAERMPYMICMYREAWTPRVDSFFKVMPNVAMLDGCHLRGGGADRSSRHTCTTANDSSCKSQPAVDGVLTGRRRKGRSIPLLLIA
jgi:hypothetical protein